MRTWLLMFTDRTVCERMNETSSIVEFVECNESHHANPKSCKAYLKTDTRQTCGEFCENANFSVYFYKMNPIFGHQYINLSFKKELFLVLYA